MNQVFKEKKFGSKVKTTHISIFNVLKKWANILTFLYETWDNFIVRRTCQYWIQDFGFYILSGELGLKHLKSLAFKRKIYEVLSKYFEAKFIKIILFVLVKRNI